MADVSVDLDEDIEEIFQQEGAAEHLQIIFDGVEFEALTPSQLNLTGWRKRTGVTFK